MSGQGKPKLKKTAQRWVNGELSASQLREELQSKHADDEAGWKQLASEVEIIRNKSKRRWRPLILNLLKIGMVMLVIAALVFLGWQWQQVNDRLAHLEATPAATQVAVATPVPLQPEASPTHTPTPEPTAPPQPRIDEITFGDVPARLYVNGDSVRLTFTVEGEYLEGQTIEFSLAPEEASTKIVKVEPIENGAGSLFLQPGTEVETISLAVDDYFGVTGLPSIDIYPSPNITASIVSSTESIDETNPVTYTLTLSNNGEKTIFNVQTQCQLPSQLTSTNGSSHAQNIESLGGGGSQKIEFEVSLNDDGTDSTVPVVCHVTAEGLQEPRTVQSAALTIVRRQIEIRNVTIDPPYMATRIESTITAEIWQGEQPLTEGVTVTVTAGDNQIKDSELITPEGGKIATKVIPEDGNVGQSVTVTVRYGDKFDTLLGDVMVYPVLEVKTNNLSFRMGPDEKAIVVVKAVKDRFFSVLRKKDEQWVQVCCEGGHLVWNGSGPTHRELYPDPLPDLGVPIMFVDFATEQKIYADPERTQPLLGSGSTENAMVEQTYDGKVLLRGWIEQKFIEFVNDKTGRIKTSPIELVLSLDDKTIKLAFEETAPDFEVDVVSWNPVEETDLIPIIVEGYLGE